MCNLVLWYNRKNQEEVVANMIYSLKNVESCGLESWAYSAVWESQWREYRECEGAETRVQSESTESRVQRVRESKVESAEIVSAKSVSRVRECRVESTESARAQTWEEGKQCTMRAQCESAEAECRPRECRVESTESVRMQSQSADYENAESRVQTQE